ncbi:DUF4190 domain-containing protein [Bifidobacterium sp. ESL0790]|uniref:DUF4190 domain-containing protein n=1 Tax=Bifidobacterium sp. ESL0790 TaxID=2983233 RepID=UPI0023F7B5E5|nr:DUF4190 domain-containing protein [Bifidobacterium sp. ESL0790]WEV72838.1 DUF4190 domain-containing protein [Bifidobacterium sp. ESL0790]
MPTYQSQTAGNEYQVPMFDSKVSGSGERPPISDAQPQVPAGDFQTSTHGPQVPADGFRIAGGERPVAFPYGPEGAADSHAWRNGHGANAPMSKSCVTAFILGIVDIALVLVALALDRYLTRGTYNPLDVLVFLAQEVAFVVCLPFSLATVIVAVAALVQIRHPDPMTGLKPRGKSLALVGLVLGALPLIAEAVLLVLP